MKYKSDAWIFEAKFNAFEGSFCNFPFNAKTLLFL